MLRRLPSRRLTQLVGFTALVAVLFMAGCGDDTMTPADPQAVTAGVFRVTTEEGAPSFVLRSDTNGDPSRPGAGPFLIRGSNIVYEEEAGALAMDLTLTNAGMMGLPYPATLTLAGLFPGDMTVLDADNDESGVGASFTFDFAQDDLTWDPDEESLPRTLRFVVAPATSIGFVARVDAGMQADGGSIGGIVFEDLDEDGMMGPEEAGIAGAKIELSSESFSSMMTMTEADGSYRFDGLPAGFYTVRKLPQRLVAPTTAVEIQVVLVEGEDGVSDFLAANFGCLFAPDPPRAELEVGDCVGVNGMYMPEPDRLVARAISFDDDEEEDDRCGWTELRGPLTDIDAENRRIWVMGTEVALASVLHHDSSDERGNDCKDRPLEEYEIGDRVRVRVLEPDPLAEEDVLVGVRFTCWRGTPDKLKGVVEAIDRDENDDIISIVVARTTVSVTADTWIGGDCDHDDDDDNDDDDDDDDDDGGDGES